MAERAARAGKLGYEPLHVGRRRAAEAVDGLPLIGNDPDIGCRRRETARSSRALARIHVLVFVDEDVLEAGLVLSAHVGVLFEQLAPRAGPDPRNRRRPPS